MFVDHPRIGMAERPRQHIVVIEDERLPLESYDRAGKQELGPRTLTIVHLERLANYAYTALAYHVALLMSRDPLRGRASLSIDLTGVGRPFGDILDTCAWSTQASS